MPFAKPDYLLILITLRTGTRPGALENATVSDYQTMCVDPATDHSVLLIAEHTRQADGPAMIMLDHELRALMDTFVHCVRPQFPPPRDDNILQVDGKAFRNGIIA